jgi:Ca2+/Na+ antiporter
MQAPVVKRTGFGWYILYLILTLLFGWCFILGLPQTVRTIITMWSSNPGYALGTVLGWLIMGVLFFLCLRQVLRIQQARSKPRS